MSIEAVRALCAALAQIDNTRKHIHNPLEVTHLDAAPIVRCASAGIPLRSTHSSIPTPVISLDVTTAIERLVRAVQGVRPPDAKDFNPSFYEDPMVQRLIRRAQRRKNCRDRCGRIAA